MYRPVWCARHRPAHEDVVAGEGHELVCSMLRYRASLADAFQDVSLAA